MNARFSCLGHHFSIRATDASLQRLMIELYEPFASEAEPVVHYNFIEWKESGGPMFAVFANARCVQLTSDPALAMAQLVWEINQASIQASSGAVLVHAAAGSREGSAVLLPSPSGSGKSTMIAGMATVGFQYLTDDVAVLEWGSGFVLPYPKPIALARSLWHLFPGLSAMSDEVRYFGQKGFLSYRDLRAALGEASQPRTIIVPHYSPGSKTRLFEMSHGDGLGHLVEQSFNLQECGVAGLETLARVAAQCRSYRLQFGDLDEAVQLVSTLDIG